MSKIMQITPCSGWYFYAEDGARKIIYPVAAWAMKDDGEVVGLVPVSAAPNGRAPRYPKLVPVPEVGGQYLLEKDLPVEIPEP